MFTDLFPGILSYVYQQNPPQAVRFTLYGPAFGAALSGSPQLDPAAPNSGFALASASNQAFQQGFPAGASYNSLALATGGAFGRPSLNAISGKISYPTYEEWNFEIEQQLTPKTVVSVNYVGNHGYHEPVYDRQANAHMGPAPLPTSAPNGSFGLVSLFSTDAVSNYNGLAVSARHRSKSLLLQLNYTYGHALDEVSDGGLGAFNPTTSLAGPINPYNLRQNYGDADYDVRHSINASYVYTVPRWRGSRVLTEGWQVSGTVFYSNGFPFSVVNGNVFTPNYNIGVLAQQTGNNLFGCRLELWDGIQFLECRSERVGETPDRSRTEFLVLRFEVEIMHGAGKVFRSLHLYGTQGEFSFPKRNAWIGYGQLLARPSRGYCTVEESIQSLPINMRLSSPITASKPEIGWQYTIQIVRGKSRPGTRRARRRALSRLRFRMRSGTRLSPRFWATNAS